jgi:hypothetical protein
MKYREKSYGVWVVQVMVVMGLVFLASERWSKHQTVTANIPKHYSYGGETISDLCFSADRPNYLFKTLPDTVKGSTPSDKTAMNQGTVTQQAKIGSAFLEWRSYLYGLGVVLFGVAIVILLGGKTVFQGFDTGRVETFLGAVFSVLSNRVKPDSNPKAMMMASTILIGSLGMFFNGYFSDWNEVVFDNATNSKVRVSIDSSSVELLPMTHGTLRLSCGDHGIVTRRVSSGEMLDQTSMGVTWGDGRVHIFNVARTNRYFFTRASYSQRVK